MSNQPEPKADRETVAAADANDPARAWEGRNVEEKSRIRANELLKPEISPDGQALGDALRCLSVAPD